jgi:hypothetical protein
MTKYSILLGAPNQLAAEALVAALVREGYNDPTVDLAPDGQVGGFPWHVGVWFDTPDLQETCEFLAEAAQAHGGDAYANSLEVM